MNRLHIGHRDDLAAELDLEHVSPCHVVESYRSIAERSGTSRMPSSDFAYLLIDPCAQTSGSIATCVFRSSYNERMIVATTFVEVGVRDLKNNLSRYLDRVREGTEVVVTERGRPIARLLAIDASTNRLADLIAAGVVQAARSPRRKLPKAIQTAGTVSDLVAEQRR